MRRLIQIMSVIVIFSMISGCDETTTSSVKSSPTESTSTLDGEDCTNHDEVNSSLSLNSVPVQGCSIK